MALQLAADEQVELLVGASQLDVGLEGHRVVALRQRIEELVHGDRLALAVALGKIVALEHARDRVSGCEPDHAVGAERREPFRVVGDFGALTIEDEEHLVGVRPGVGGQLVGCQRRARDVAAGRVADHAGKIAN